jgi:hypothetical protein
MSLSLVTLALVLRNIVRIRPPNPTRRQRPTIPPQKIPWYLLIFFLTRTSISPLFHWCDHISHLTAISS